MSAKDIFLKVKALFDAPLVAPVAPVVPVAPVQAAAPVAPIVTGTPFKLKDGTDISIVIEDPAVSMEPDAGDMVTVAGAPAPEGEMELEDGTKITVDATGMITAVTPMEPLTQPDFVAPPVISLEDRIKALEAKVAVPVAAPAMPVGYATESQFNIVEQKSTKQDEVIKGLFELVEEMMKLPTAEPKTLTGERKDAFERMDKKEKQIDRFAAGIKALREEAKK